ncbi:hypothetical protein A8C56_02775 [Niabella ginsenosidivorans]|uniref:Uncharacterized protein n=1 Tax=Niabella ginsenosidivorans TaxID=1176587 RepID=A0A1A9HXD1_9BACT|nr:hypothetical protein [Niabella ginsenosidivorans]ANH80047.1 hypothetical protein A8C56_02775 [Niabella ginsenosidivorans]
MSKVIDIKPGRSYRQKLQVLLWSVIPLLLLCYLLGFKKTGGIVKDYHNNVRLQQQGSLLADSMAVFEKRLSAVAAWKKQYLADSSGMDGKTLAAINNLCNSLELELKEYKPLGKSNQGIWTRMVTVSGPFQKILSLISQLEQKERLCRIASVKYQKIKDGEKEELVSTLYIQNILEK